MIIIKATPECTGAYANQECPDNMPVPDGYMVIPQVLRSAWNQYAPFIKPVITDDTVTAIADNPEARQKAQGTTLEQLQNKAISNIDGCCSVAIASGVTVNKLHYTLTTIAQQDLAVMAAKVKTGATNFLYHADGEAMRLYNADEITAIAAAATEWVTVNTTYYDLLKTWITQETDTDKLKDIKYGSKLPDDLMSQFETLLKSVGVDVTKYVSLFS